jgi:hypothetical protein
MRQSTDGKRLTDLANPLGQTLNHPKTSLFSMTNESVEGGKKGNMTIRPKANNNAGDTSFGFMKPEEEEDIEFKLSEFQPLRNTGTYFIEKEFNSKRGTIESVNSVTRSKFEVKMKVDENNEVTWENLPDFLR